MNISVLHIVVAKNWGGGEQYVYNICREMRSRGIDSYVAVDSSNVIFQKKFSETAAVFKTNLYFAAGIMSISELAGFIDRKNIKIVNCHSGHALLLCLILKQMTGVKVIMYKHNALPGKNDIYHRWQRKKTDAFVCVSNLVYNLQTAGLSQKDKEKYHLIYNGIDCELLNKGNDNKKDGENFSIGYAGRIASDKGIEILIEAFGRLKSKYSDIKLYLAGSDEKGYLSVINNLIETNKIFQDCIYLGKLDDMEEFYKSLDVLVLPSVVREAFGLVICEALYCGIPVITTDSGAQQEIITDETLGIIVKRGNEDELFAALEKVYLERNNSLKLVDYRKNYIEKNFNISICVDNLLNLYRKIIY